MAKLIINSDDFGFTPLINEAILQAHHNGLVSSTTVMVNQPAAAEGIERALGEAPALALGLHINLTDGSPVSEASSVSSLVDENGQFYPIERLAEVALQFDTDELYEEIAAQLEWFVALVGKSPTHMDAHYHVAYMHPMALEATLAIAHENELPLRNLRMDNLQAETVVPAIQAFLPFLPEAFIMPLVEMIKEVLARSPQPYCPATFDNRFHEGHNTLGNLLNYLLDAKQAEEPTEIMCHMGFIDDPGITNGASRQMEFDSMTHPAAIEIIEKMGIELTNFGEFKRE